MRRLPIRSDSRQPRRGYTLLELLVVIGLILFMMTVLVMTIGNAIGSAKENATRATLVKIDGLLQQRLDAFNTNFDKANKRGEIDAQANSPLFRKYLSDNGLASVPTQVRPLLVRKYRFRQAFPQTGNSIGNVGPDSPGLIGIPANQGPFYNNLQNEAESSEYLYYMLVKSDFFGVPPVDADEFSSSEVGDTDNDSRLEFLDAWGRPLRFYRWPTQVVRPRGLSFPPDQAVAQLVIGGIPPTPVSGGGDSDPWARDPDDQLAAFSRMQLPQNVDPANVASNFEKTFHTLRTFHVPLIISAGRDNKLGLLEPYVRSMPPNAPMGYLGQPNAVDPSIPIPYQRMIDQLSDNITSRNVKTR